MCGIALRKGMVMFMKKKIISLIVSLALAVPAALGVLPSLSERYSEKTPLSDGDITYPVELTEENFPDENFRTYLKAEADKDSDGSLSRDEILQITQINVSDKEIKSIKGIEFFSELTQLQCDTNELTSIDISSNTKLKSFSCNRNILKSLNLKENTALEYLQCQGNEIESLDVSNNVNLVMLWCSVNKLTSLDLSKNTNLRSFECYSNPIAYIDFTNTKISSLSDGSYLPYTKPIHCEDSPFDFNINELPDGFDISKVTWTNDILPDKDGIFKNLEINDVIRYSYNSGNGISSELSIFFSPVHDVTEINDVSSLCTIYDKLKQVWHCENCDKYFLEESALTEIKVKGTHNFDEGEVKKEPTCSQNGIFVRQCLDCGKMDYSVIPMTAHTPGSKYEYNYCQHWNLCTECGQETDREYHTFDDGSKTCSVCGESFEHRHDLKKVDTKYPTCMDDGINEHYYCAGCDKYFEDENCENEILLKDLLIEKVDHNYITAFNDTEHWRECTFCAVKKDVETHILDESLTDPTCGQEGLKTIFCTECEYIKKQTIPATENHSFTGKYKDLGKEEGHCKICDICGEYGEPAEHEYDIEIIEPTCIESGKMIYTCKQCSNTFFETTDEATGEHSFSPNFTYDKNEHWHKCEIKGCDSESVHEAHEWDEGKITVAPTFESEGKRTYTCAVCLTTKSEKIDKLPAPVTEPDSTAPVVTGPVTTDPVATDPEITNPDVTSPDETYPDETDPDEPALTDPAITKPDIKDPETTTDSKNDPDVIVPSDTSDAVMTTAPENVGDKNDSNMETGLIISFIPAAAAAAAVMIFKKKGGK